MNFSKHPLGPIIGLLPPWNMFKETRSFHSYPSIYHHVTHGRFIPMVQQAMHVHRRISFVHRFANCFFDQHRARRLGLFSPIGRQLFHAGVMRPIHPTFDNKRIRTEMLARMVLIMAYSHFLYVEISSTLDRRISISLCLVFVCSSSRVRSLVRLLKY